MTSREEVSLLARTELALADQRLAYLAKCQEVEELRHRLTELEVQNAGLWARIVRLVG
jgi:hypothetical protein